MKFRWDKKYLYWGATAFFVILFSIAAYWLLGKIPAIVAVLRKILRVLRPFIYGVFMAYILNKLVDIFEKYVFNGLGRKLFPKKAETGAKFSRALSVATVHLLAVGLLVGLLVLVLPQLYYSVESIINNSSSYLSRAVTWVRELLQSSELGDTIASYMGNFTDYFRNWLEKNVMPEMNSIISNITGGVLSIVKELFSILLGFVISIYILYNKEAFKAQAKKLLYSIFKIKTANRIMYEFDIINDVFGNFIVGELIDSLIIGIATYIFMLIAGMPYAELIAIIVAVTNLIPTFGPFIGAIPSAILILLENPLKCLIFVIFIIILQQIDGNILKPKILGKRAGLSGFWIIFAIVFFGGMHGVLGMLLGVPITAVLYNFIKRFNRKQLKKKGIPVETSEFKNISRIDEQTGKPIYKTKSEDIQSEEIPE